MLNQMIITSIEEVFTVDSAKGRQFQMHCRPCYGITFCYGGQITYYQNGKAVVSDRNHMVLLPEGQDYFLYGDASGLFPVINIHCTPEFKITAPTAFPISHPETYLKNYERLKELFLLGKNQAKCMSILYDLLSSIAAENAGGNRIAAGAAAYMEQHYSNAGLTNQNVADHLEVSEVYFRRLFREEFHTTPKQYILDLRLRKAKQLLAEGHLPVNEISEICGFSSVYHFSRAFRQAAGLSPTEYRNNARKVII